MSNREEKITPIDTWAETTPTVSFSTIKEYIERSRQSSQAQNYIAGLCVCEILTLDGVYVSESRRKEFEEKATKIIQNKIKDLIEDSQRVLNKELVNAESKILQLEEDKRSLIKKINSIKKASFDYLRDDDREKFTKFLYEGKKTIG